MYIRGTREPLVACYLFNYDFCSLVFQACFTSLCSDNQLRIPRVKNRGHKILEGARFRDRKRIFEGSQFKMVVYHKFFTKLLKMRKKRKTTYCL